MKVDYIDQMCIPYVEPGTTVYYPILNEDIVVETTVRCSEDVYSDNGNTLWHFRYADGVSKYDGVLNNEQEDTRLKAIVDNNKPVNQFLDINEPIGHALWINDEVFLSVDEALRCVNPSKKKHLRRRLKRWRMRSVQWILSTHCIAGRYGAPPKRGEPAISEMLRMYNPNPRIYVRR